jgi:hypothetical protein
VELVKGAWANHTCAIIGGGPSLKGVDFSRIPKQHKIIAINAGFLYAPQADICFSEDVRFIERFGLELQKFPGEVVWHCLKGIDPERGLKACPKIKIIRELRDDKFWSSDLSSLSFSSNSGVGAINLAEILGASHLFLLGFDCRHEGLTLQNFHSDYPQEWQVTSMNAISWKSDFEYWVAPNCTVPIANVINPLCESALECWPKLPFKHFFE